MADQNHGRMVDVRNRIKPIPYPGSALCKISTCDGPRRARGWCQTHYSRWQRHGSTMEHIPVRARNRKQPKGVAYARVGNKAVHRIVLFNKIGPGEHPCHWCGGIIAWEKPVNHPDRLTADHLDGRTLNNDPANLVPAHRSCNSRRAHTVNPAGADWVPTARSYVPNLMDGHR